MQLALNEAANAFSENETPIGAIVTIGNAIIGRGHNMVEKLQDATAHAEMIALTSAMNEMGAKYLPEATLYVTIEPCLMCAGALYWSKVGRIVVGAADVKNGALHFCEVHKKMPNDWWPFHPKTELIQGILPEKATQLMKDFFSAKR